MNTSTADLTDRWNKTALNALAKCQPGWATGDELSWNVFQSAECIRGRTRAVLRQLAADGVLKCFEVRHRGDVMDCYLLDPGAIEALL